MIVLMVVEFLILGHISFLKGNNVNQWVAYPQYPEINTPPSGGIPYDSHRDNSGAFAIKGETCIYSPFEYFLIRDEDFYANTHNYRC